MKNDKNSKTTLFGLLGGFSIAIDSLIKDGLTGGWPHALLGICIALMGYYAQDSSNTPTEQK